MIRAGLIPTVMDTAATALGLTSRKSKLSRALGWSIAAVGAAQIVLRAIDFVDSRR